jgi:hypothetical protein
VPPRSFSPLKTIRLPSGENAGSPSSAVTGDRSEMPLPSLPTMASCSPASNTSLFPSAE